MAYRHSLLDLAGAVEAGMDPTTAYSIYQNLSGQHQATVQQNQQQLGSVVDMIMQGAQSGLPYDQMQMLAQAAAPKFADRPRVTGALETLYPDAVPSAMSSPLDSSMGRGGGIMGQEMQQQVQQNTQSPVYQPDPAAIQASMELEQMMQSQALAPRWQEFTQNLMEAVRAKPDDIAGIVRTSQTYYSDLLNADPQKFQAIVQSAVGSTSLGQPGA